MGCALLPDSSVCRKLKEINPHFFPEWDRKRNRWKIMSQAVGHPPKFVTLIRGNKGEYIPIDERTYLRLRKILWYNRKLNEYVHDLLKAEKRMNESKDKSEYDKYKEIAKELRRPVQMLSRQLGITSGKAKIPYSCGWSK